MNPRPSYLSPAEAFGRLRLIAPANLLALGKRIREKVFHVNTTNSHCVEAMYGSYNLVFVLQLDKTRMVIRVPACGKSGSLTGPAERWLKSNVQTLKYITANTTIPVPKVYDFDTTADNEIAAPYTAMSFIEGHTVGEIWFRRSGPTSREERRQRILQQLARFMVQLSLLSFDRIGSLSPDPNGGGDVSVGPSFDFGWTNQGDMTINETGPIVSSRDWMRCFWASPYTLHPGPGGVIHPGPEGRRDSYFNRGTIQLLKTIGKMIPEQTSHFSLAPPDLDYYNVMADERGIITGIIDWDNTQTVPDFLGCLRYPAWILWDRFDDDPRPDVGTAEGRARELPRNQAYYLEQVTEALVARGRGAEAQYTKNSEFYESFWLAFINVQWRFGVCRTLVERVKGFLLLEGDPIPDAFRKDFIRILENLGGDRLSSVDKDTLKRALRAEMDF
ncbi:hypothetical protein DHEL01_v206936 [Diaporthe helianthi]|uniref:Aminoglycoside phosphotransferase domain-containing protein n=1 Tax=Diaporthe helianthi TaxID=158607 RepID=A0A2P5HWQ6_DIAHE|nr:hypothetical protein DHEL01_v206936 [Diaporthe helianthi]